MIDLASFTATGSVHSRQKYLFIYRNQHKRASFARGEFCGNRNRNIYKEGLDWIGLDHNFLCLRLCLLCQTRGFASDLEQATTRPFVKQRNELRREATTQTQTK